MNRIRFIVLSLVAVTLLSHRPTLAQEPEGLALPKPLAMRGSMEVKVDEKGNLIVTPKIFASEERTGVRNVCRTVIEPREESYQVEVDEKSETRTRTVNVSRQVPQPVSYKYKVGFTQQEAGTPLINPRRKTPPC